MNIPLAIKLTELKDGGYHTEFPTVQAGILKNISKSLESAIDWIKFKSKELDVDLHSYSLVIQDK